MLIFHNLCFTTNCGRKFWILYQLRMVIGVNRISAEKHCLESFYRIFLFVLKGPSVRAGMWLFSPFVCFCLFLLVCLCLDKAGGGFLRLQVRLRSGGRLIEADPTRQHLRTLFAKETLCYVIESV